MRKIFLEDWELKLTALVITLALWFGVTGLATPTTKRLTVPLQASISNNAEITNALVREVDIVVSGDKRRLDQINRADLVATLDLTDKPPGESTVSLSPDNVYVPLPQGVRLTDIQPSRIAVNLEAVDEQDVDVAPQIGGTPAPGYEVYGVTATPGKVKVRGPASFVKTLESVETDRIDVTDKKADFTSRQIAVRVANPKVGVYTTVVDVNVRIGEKRVERSFTLPVPGLPGKTVSFIVYGPRTLLAKAKPDSFKVELVLNDTGEEVPRVILPADLQDVAEVRTENDSAPVPSRNKKR